MTSNPASSKHLYKTVALVLVVLEAFAAVVAPQFPDPGHPGMSRDEQIQLGFQTAAQVYKQMPVLPDNSPETQYIRKLGTKLVSTIPSQNSWPFEFHVIPQKEINAFALPGGPMFVNIGTITAASNEAELAGVMAHEMSHVYMQHSAKQAGKAQTTSMLAGLAGLVLGATTKGTLGSLAQYGIQFGAQGLMLKYSRDDEAQADAVGAIILYKAGYNPKSMADFFQKLAAEGSSGPQFLSDHPNPGNRQEAIQAEIAQWPPKKYSTNATAFNTARQHAVGVRAYSGQEIEQGAKSGQWAQLNQQKGATFRPPTGVPVSATSSTPPTPAGKPVSIDSVLPSAQLVTSDLGPLKIARPNNWQVIPPAQNGQDLRIAPPAGISGDSVGYGVVINGVKPPNGQSMNVDQLTSELVRSMSSGGDLSPIGQAQPITVAGVQGRSLAMQSTSPFPDAKGQPQKERDWLVTVPRSDGSFVYLVFVAPQAEFERFRPSYENMLRTLQFRD